MKAIEYLESLLESPKSNGSNLPVVFKEKNFKKGNIITRYEQVENKMYFIKKGIVILEIMCDEEEKIIDFFNKNSFVCSYTSFILQKPSDVQVVALTDCELEYLQYHELNIAYGSSFEANKLGRLLTEQIYITKSNREKDFLTKSADVRYLELMNQNPELIQLIPVNKIAKYLGIHPESLSRIRRKIIS